MPARKHVGRARTARRVVFLAFCSLAVWSLIAWGMARWLVVGNAVDESGLKNGRADFIIVLAGSSHYKERTAEAARLWRAGVAPRIILTNDGVQGGWVSALQRNPYFVERARWELETNNVPSVCIVELQGVVRSTHDEAVATRHFVQREGTRSVLVVTSAYHTRRALWTFNRVFAREGVYIATNHPPPDETAPSSSTWWLGIDGWRDVAGEYVKFSYYYMRY